jgi:hypothetical protein
VLDSSPGALAHCAALGPFRACFQQRLGLINHIRCSVMSNVISVLRRLVFCVSLCALCAVPTLAQAAAVYLQAPNSDSNGQYYASVTSEAGFSDGGAATQFAPFGISAATAGNYRTGDWSNAQEANLGTGVMRSSMLYASGGDRSEYELDNYITMLDTLTFHGSGSAVFDLHLTGNFSGAWHSISPATRAMPMWQGASTWATALPVATPRSCRAPPAAVITLRWAV